MTTRTRLPLADPQIADLAQTLVHVLTAELRRLGAAMPDATLDDLAVELQQLLARHLQRPQSTRALSR